MVQTFSNYVKTHTEYADGWLTIFEIDDTLFRTTASIRVRNSTTKETIRTLTTAQFASYKLGAN